MTALAGAAADATISGTIAVPDGVKIRKLRVSAWASDGCFGTDPCCCEYPVDGKIEPSGAFAVQGLSPGRRYHVALDGGSQRVVDGYYAGGGRGLVYEAADGLPVVAPSSDVLLAPDAAVAISGSVELPAGVRRKDVSVTAEEVVGPGAGSCTYTADVRKDRSFELPGLERGTVFRIYVSGDGRRDFTGYYTGTGPLVESADEALLVTAPLTDLVIRAADIAPLLG